MYAPLDNIVLPAFGPQSEGVPPNATAAVSGYLDDLVATPLPKPVSPKSKSPAFAATVGAKARERIRGLLGRPRSYNDGDPPASLFSVQGHANFFATFDETTLVDSPMLCL
ncbi:unnamed protein product (mitochondrion) [Plasmodiophora brassicae]|uniref:Uncharacterized protein n=1 Tax=Plasmodiophora brassicae TaxID=37360 RepID=A0A3P3Y5Q6_PLABS|nr:unnamed protein product [Plasmodiophora brassicae]